MHMKPESTEIVKPEPYFKVKFGCSNRAFYRVQNVVHRAASKIDEELWDTHVIDKCDYECDLEEITICRGELGEYLIKKVFAHYGIKDEVPDEMRVVLSIF